MFGYNNNRTSCVSCSLSECVGFNVCTFKIMGTETVGRYCAIHFYGLKITFKNASFISEYCCSYESSIFLYLTNRNLDTIENIIYFIQLSVYQRK